MERTHEEWQAAFRQRLRRQQQAPAAAEQLAPSAPKRATKHVKSYDGPGWSIEKSKRGAASQRRTLDQRHQALLAAGVKTCSACKETKPLDQYQMRARNERQIYRSVCRACDASARRRRRQELKEEAACTT